MLPPPQEYSDLRMSLVTKMASSGRVYRLMVLAASAAIIFVGCERSNTLIAERPQQWRGFGLDDVYVYRLALGEKSLYACAGARGLWRRHLSGSSSWQNLGFADTGRLNYFRYGITDVDVRGEDILVLFSVGDAETIDSTLVGIWRSKNGGRDFVRTDSGITDPSGHPSHLVNSIERSYLNPSDGIALYGTRFHTSNGGDTWFRDTPPYGPGPFEDAKWNPGKVGDVWVYGQSSFFEDFVGHSGPVGQFPPELTDTFVRDIAFAVTDSNVVYLSLSSLMRSSDNGAHWTLPMGDRSLTFSHLLGHPQRHNVLYLVSGNTVYRSDDGGNSIISMGSAGGGSPTSIVIDGKTDILYIGKTVGVYKYSQ